MKIFHINPWAAAIILTICGMGVIGLIVVLPIACIQWMWNSTVPNFSALPPINMWQAVLLYTAAATVLFLSGLVDIKIEMEHSD